MGALYFKTPSAGVCSIQVTCRHNSDSVNSHIELRTKDNRQVGLVNNTVNTFTGLAATEYVLIVKDLTDPTREAYINNNVTAANPSTQIVVDFANLNSSGGGGGGTPSSSSPKLVKPKLTKG